MKEVSEIDLQNRIRVALSVYGMVFRMNSGTFFQGKQCKDPEGRMILRNIRAVKCGVPGMSDLLFVGLGRIVWLEVKLPGKKPSVEQQRFIAMMKKTGHAAGVVRSVDEAIALACPSDPD